jgi:hypothetical protein
MEIVADILFFHLKIHKLWQYSQGFIVYLYQLKKYTNGDKSIIS